MTGEIKNEKVLDEFVKKQIEFITFEKYPFSPKETYCIKVSFKDTENILYLNSNGYPSDGRCFVTSEEFFTNAEGKNFVSIKPVDRLATLTEVEEFLLFSLEETIYHWYGDTTNLRKHWETYYGVTFWKFTYGKGDYFIFATCFTDFSSRSALLLSQVLTASSIKPKKTVEEAPNLNTLPEGVLNEWR